MKPKKNKDKEEAEFLSESIGSVIGKEIGNTINHFMEPWWKRIFKRRPKTPWFDAMAKKGE